MRTRRRAMVAASATAVVLLVGGQTSAAVQRVPGAASPGDPGAAAALVGPTPSSAGRTDVVSALDGGGTPAPSTDPQVSADGRWVVFSSTAALQPTSGAAKPDQRSVFVRDLVTGSTVQLTEAHGDGAPFPPNGGSELPSISANGRFVTFLTQATDIVTAHAAPASTLVLCDRDPDGNGTYDQRNANGALTNVCLPVYSGPQSGAGSIETTDRPAQPTTSNFVTWTQSAGSGITHVWTTSWGIDSTTHALTVNAPTRVPMKLSRPTAPPCGSAPASGDTTSEDEPGFGARGDTIVMRVTFLGGNECTAVVGTAGYLFPASATSVRYDTVPAACRVAGQSTFFGDHPQLGGECSGGFGAGDTAVSQPVMNEAGTEVLFHYRDAPPPTPGFVGPRFALAPGVTTNWAVLATDAISGTTHSVSSAVVSRDNSGTVVDAAGASLSADGRYLAFATSAPGTHDGAPPASGTPTELVGRDLVEDAARAADGRSRLPGALVTPRDSNLPADCTPAAQQSCGSDGTSAFSISLDENGARVAYASNASDLTPTATTGSAAYVRTWTPAPADQAVQVGSVQTGASKTVDVPIGVTGFGPLMVDGSTLSGPDAGQFAVVGDGCVGTFGAALALHESDTCTVSVRFQPTSNGVKTATIQLGDAGFYPATVAGARLTGTAVPTGPKNAPADSVRASLNPAGGQIDGFDSGQSMVSGNGRWDVFVSRADVTGRKADPAGQDHENVYVRDLADPQNTVQISLHTPIKPDGPPDVPARPVATTGHPRGQNPNGDSFFPSISSDGRFVSFVTEASDVVATKQAPEDATGVSVGAWHVVVCDRDPDGNGVFDEPRPAPNTGVPNEACFPVESGFDNQPTGSFADETVPPRLSGDGTRIAWVEITDGGASGRRVVVATLAVPGGPLQPPANYLHVPSSVVGFQHAATRFDGVTDVEQTLPVLNEAGSEVVYWARQHNDVGIDRVALIDTTLPANIGAHVDTRLDTDDNGATFLGDAGFRTSFLQAPAVSDDGRRVAFMYNAPGGTGPLVRVVTRSGTALSTLVVSRDNSDTPALGDEPALSGDGRYVAFRTRASDMSNGVDPAGGDCSDRLAGSQHAFCQIVARDLVRDAQRRAAGLPREDSELVSTSVNTECPNPPPAGRLCAGSGDAENPSVDNTGSEVGFDSLAQDIVPGDTNVTPGEGFNPPAEDSFVHTWRPSVITTSSDFGSVRVGTSRDLAVVATVQDSGEAPVAFGPISLGTAVVGGTNATDFAVTATDCAGTTLHVGPPDGAAFGTAAEKCSYTVRFTPKAPGNRKANLQTPIGKNSYPRHNPAGTITYTPAINRDLTGFGALPIAVVNPAALDFGTRLPIDPLTRSVKLTNVGTSPLVVGAATVVDTTHPGARGDYAVDSSSCFGSIPVTGSCFVQVTFTGHAVGVRDAVLVLTLNTATGVLKIPTRARVGKPTVQSNPAVSPVRRVVTVTGTGYAPGHEVQIGFDGNKQATAVTKPDGSFSYELVILANGPQGPRMLFARSTGLDASISDDFPFLVVLSSTDPGVVVKRDG